MERTWCFKKGEGLLRKGNKGKDFSKQESFLQTCHVKSWSLNFVSCSQARLCAPLVHSGDEARLVPFMDKCRLWINVSPLATSSRVTLQLISWPRATPMY